MKDSIAFGERLKQSLTKAGYELRPVVLEREFNQRYWVVLSVRCYGKIKPQQTGVAHAHLNISDS